MSEPMSGGRRRVDRVLGEGFLDGLGEMTLQEVRQRRFDAEQEDADLSYIRRLLQGRMDIIRAEQQRRATASGDADPLVDQLAQAGIPLQHLDLGGGVGIRYRDETPIVLRDYAREVSSRLKGFGGRLLLEPGRRIVGNGGLLLTRVEYLKSSVGHCFAIVDAAMNDLIRPSLYEAWHEILPVTESTVPAVITDVVGPVCETGDILGRARKLAVAQGDLLAILSAGAYGASMGSNYNARPRPPEILVDGDRAHLIRRRESIKDLYRDEWPIPDDL